MTITLQCKELYLKDLHERNGAKFGVFAGFNMPITYPMGVMQEHLHTREKAGLFDISHMRIIEASGVNVEELLRKCVPLLPEKMAVGKSQYSFLLNDNAGIIDDLIISKILENRYFIVVNAANAEKDYNHIVSLNKYGCNVTFLDRVILALQGPKSAEIMDAVGLKKACELNFMSSYLNDDGWFIARSGYTGEDGFEISLPPEQAMDFAESLLNYDDVKLIGLAARDTLRLEAGLCLHGNDISENITPLEARLMWAVPKELKGDNLGNGVYVGCHALAKAKKEKFLAGFLPNGRQPARAGAKIFDAANQEIGIITSGSFSPSLQRPIAMGYISCDYKDSDVEIYAEQRGKRIKIELCKMPFVEHRYFRIKK